MRKDEIIAAVNGFGDFDYLRSWLTTCDLHFFTHPLGFVQAKWQEEGRLFRLNLWARALAKPKMPDWRIHNHAFSFASYVLVGELRDQRYEEAIGGVPYRKYKVAYSKGAASSSLICTDSVLALRCKQSSIFRSGDRYTIESNELHSTESINDVSLSLMELLSSPVGSAIVYGDVDSTGELDDYVSSAVPLEQVMTVLK